MNDIQNYLNFLGTKLMEYSPKLFSSILLLVVGLWLISMVTKSLKKIMTKRNVEPTLGNFLGNLIFWILRVLLFVIVISKLGIETSSLVAILGAAGLAVGLALQGSLSNFAGGILIILFKPFKVNDLIEAQGEIGTVQEIQIFSTKLINAVNQTIYIPNGILSNGVIINYTQQGRRRIDQVIGISYNANIAQAKEVLLNALKSHPNILQEPEPQVFVVSLADSSVNLSVRAWVLPENFMTTSSDILEFGKQALDQHDIEIPFPQRVVTLKNH
ncbi:MAG: mechanosensitive ion channel [Flavobacteriales bacterium]|nr:mechanosensitive ion channel [Flavobacteriales bacterium]MBS4039989.1 mechanosensitive ion channel [Flavobacteriales bacterium]